MEQPASATPPPDTSGDTPALRQAKAFDSFLNQLKQTFDTFVNDESVTPPVAGWVSLDNSRRHRDNLGFRRHDELADALLQRVRQHLTDRDLAAVARDGSVGLVLDPQGGERDLAAWGKSLIKDVNAGLFELSDQMVALTVSIGLSPFGSKARSADEPLLQAARLAETVAASGGGRVKYQESTKTGPAASGDNRSVLNLLVRSLKANTVKVVFQPLVSVSGKDNGHYQILPRLQDDNGVLIPASRFIPLAGRHGILPALDRWMLAWSMKFIERRMERKQPVVLFVNQSAALVEDDNFVGWLEKKLAANPAVASGLVLEFRLDYLLAHLKESRAALERLTTLGVGIGVTGVDEDTSAEVVLEHIPSDFLRMGPGFAHRLQDDEDLSRRYEAFADRAQSSGRKLIIPMLENADAVARIWRARVDLVQGNFIQRPAEDLEE